MKTLPSLTRAACFVAVFLPLAPLRATSVAAETKTFPDLGLTLVLPELTEMTETLTDQQVRGTWRGKLGETRIAVQLSVLPIESFGFAEPDDVAVLIGDNVGRDANATFERTGMMAGPYGFAPYATLAVSKRHLEGSTKPDVSSYYLCGLTEKAGYVIDVECRPALEGKAAEPVLAFLKDGVRYDGPTRVNEWTDEDAVARYMKDTPEDCHDEMEKLIRTKHYIILTNSSGGKKFGEKMEECYETIRQIFPFEEVEGRKLMPVFLFQTNEEYFEFCVKVAKMTRSQAEATGGHAWKDYYATWFKAASDPVHIHEATHQIFSNRLGLTGGGSWFQEGMAEYVSTKDNERNPIATQVKKGRALPLREFVQVQSLALSGHGDVTGNPAGDLYKQAALLTEFLREGEEYKDQFQRYVHTMGKVQRGNVEAIEAVFEEIYSKDLDEMQEAWQAYCKKR